MTGAEAAAILGPELAAQVQAMALAAGPPSPEALDQVAAIFAALPDPRAAPGRAA